MRPSLNWPWHCFEAVVFFKVLDEAIHQVIIASFIG